MKKIVLFTEHLLACKQGMRCSSRMILNLCRIIIPVLQPLFYDPAASECTSKIRVQFGLPPELVLFYFPAS